MTPTQTEIEGAVARIRSEDFARQTTASSDVEKLVRSAHGDAVVTAAIERELARVLDTPASQAGKQFACKLLGRIGGERSVTSLERMLVAPDVPLAEAACCALLSNPSPAAGRALRSALAKARGRALEGAIAALAARCDPLAVSELARLAESGGASVPAIRALGKISGLPARDVLMKLAASGSGETRRHAGHALLECAQQLDRNGEKAEARAVGQALMHDAADPQVRRGAALSLGLSPPAPTQPRLPGPESSGRSLP